MSARGHRSGFRGRGNIHAQSPATPSPSPAGRGSGPLPPPAPFFTTQATPQSLFDSFTQLQPESFLSASSKASPPTTKAVPTPTWGSASRSGLVTIAVGASGNIYCLYEALLTHHSECFRNALKGSWKEAEERKIRLQDVEPAEFNIFVHWLHAQSLPEHDLLAWERVTESNDATSGTHLLQLVKAYALGDRLLSLAFRRAVIGAIVSAPLFRVMNTHIRDYVELTQFAFAHVPAERPILQLLVDQFCLGWHEQTDKGSDTLKTLPAGFMMRALRIFARNRDRPGRPVAERCYDEHLTEEEKKTCGEVHMDWDKQHECGYFE